MNLTNTQFQVNEKVIIARASDGDPAAAAYLNYVGKVVGHFIPYTIVDLGGAGFQFILERDLERYLG